MRGRGTHFDDGRLSPHARHEVVAFQRDLHMAVSWASPGGLDGDVTDLYILVGGIVRHDEEHGRLRRAPDHRSTANSEPCGIEVHLVVRL